MLAISLDTLAHIVAKARAYDAQVPAEGLEEGSNASDDQGVAILEDTADNPTRAELLGMLEALNEDEVIELLALVWLGRGDYGAAEWRQAWVAARAAHDARAPLYLLETPNLADLVEQGLAELGQPLDAAAGL